MNKVDAIDMRVKGNIKVMKMISKGNNLNHNRECNVDMIGFKNLKEFKEYITKELKENIPTSNEWGVQNISENSMEFSCDNDKEEKWITYTAVDKKGYSSFMKSCFNIVKKLQGR